MEVIQKYFPKLSTRQLEQFSMLKSLYEEWNAKINVISRKDMEQFNTRHLLHSLSIVKLNKIKPNQKILDVGTGGGFPGIPLAIYYPHCEFLLVDSIGKKIKVVNAVAEALGLTNLKAIQERMEKIKYEPDIIVSRAVAPAIELVQLTRKISSKSTAHIFIKGGDLKQEKKELMAKLSGSVWKEYQISDWFEDEYFETKKLVYFKA